MLTIELLISTILVIVAVKNLSQIGKKCVEDFVVSKSWFIFKQIESFSYDLFSGKLTLKISSGNTFTESWLEFESLIHSNLSLLDFKTNISKAVLNSSSLMIQFKLNQGSEHLFSIITCYLKKNLEFFLKNHAKEEIAKISINLKSKNFFNLSKNGVPNSLMDHFSLGRKFTPYFNLSFSKELNRFDSEIHDIFTQFAFGYKMETESKNVFSLFNKLLSLPEIRLNAYKLKMLTFAFKLFKRTQANFQYSLHSYLPDPFIQTESDFSKKFKLPVNQIILAADKNIGFVCMDTVDVLHQYVLINEQQHFGKVTFDEPTYIDFILNFINSARFSIPHELSSILKPSDFSWSSNISTIGVL